MRSLISLSMPAGLFFCLFSGFQYLKNSFLKIFLIFFDLGLRNSEKILRYIGVRQKPGNGFPHCTLTTEYTFNKYIPDRSIMLSRMKVRQEPPARKGYHGKQGGERFRIILKYPVATDKAMKRLWDNDTSLRGWRRTRQR